jgi:murein DD-endopeptidase MepM/ murein hydrolase activator NlpD
MRSGILMLLSVIFFPSSVWTQSDMSHESYAWPVKAEKKFINNFGKIRPEHWHMGLDISTGEAVGKEVIAAADGYIAKVKVEPFGFGKSIYINHPNGQTTVYGHLKQFFPLLDSVVKDKQYKLESWNVELSFLPDEFPVKKGQFIAWSGNSGASMGPHLHFELRTTSTDRCLNPLLYAFHIPDDLPPVFSLLSMYDREKSVYDQRPEIFNLSQTDSGFIVRGNPLLMTGSSKLSFSIAAYDRINGSERKQGIFSAKIIYDSLPILEFAFDSITYIESNYVHANIDYSYHYNGGEYLQHLSKLPGDRGRIYHEIQDDGVIGLNDTLVHHLAIETRDEAKNVSILKFSIRRNDSLKLGHSPKTNPFVPRQVNIFDQGEFQAWVDEFSVYDTVYPGLFRRRSDIAGAFSDEFTFGEPSVPLHTELSIAIKPSIPISKGDSGKIVVRYQTKNALTWKKAIWQKEKLASKFSGFGSFQLFRDKEPPVVDPPGRGDTIDLSSSSHLVFKPRDNTAIERFRGELDGKWILFANDKGKNFVYDFDDHFAYGTHSLKLIVSDLVGNVTIKTWWVKRGPWVAPIKKHSKKGKHQARKRKKSNPLRNKPGKLH